MSPVASRCIQPASSSALALVSLHWLDDASMRHSSANCGNLAATPRMEVRLLAREAPLHGKDIALCGRLGAPTLCEQYSPQGLNADMSDTVQHTARASKPA